MKLFNIKLLLFFSFPLLSLGTFAKNVEAKEVKMCNYSTTEKVSVAYSRYIDGDWWVQGWRHIDQGDCDTFYHEGNTFYYYAKSYYRDDKSEWTGDYRRCVISDKFRILKSDSCNQGRWEYFKRKETPNENKTIRLID